MKLQARKIVNSEITVYHYDSEMEGPKVAITANLHGDEVNGVAVVQQILENASLLQCGELILYPSLNPRGLRRNMRSLPPWNKDINRQFPGDKYGDELERYVSGIWADISSYELDLLIDVHTDAGHAYPYVLLDRQLTPNLDIAKKMWEIGEASGIFTVWEYPLPRYRQYALHNSLAGRVLNQLKTASITLEIGPRSHVRPIAVAQAVTAITNILVFLDMMPTTQRQGLSFTRPLGVWHRENGPIAKEMGLVFPIAPLGKRLEKRTAIANIINEEGLIQERIFAERTCVILAYPNKGYIQKGQAVCTLAILEQ